MIKIAFVNTDLRGGGAEKVLVNLVNNLDYTQYEVTVFTVFKEGINRQYLNPEVKQKWFLEKPFKGYSRLQLLFSPEQLYKKMLKEEKYDVVISYLEGFPSRVVSGCKDKDTLLLSWIHLELYKDTIGYEFRNAEEANKLYNRFDHVVCVANTVRDCFLDVVNMPNEKVSVMYNLLNLEDIETNAEKIKLEKLEKLKLVTVGRLNPQKGYDRLLRIINRLHHEDGFDFHLDILGVGPMEGEFKKYVKDNKLEEVVSFLGYQTNPYPYMKNADLFVCSSNKEGYSTVVTESILLETPVVTTDCSGMAEILDDGRVCLITKNDEDALYEGLKEMLEDKQKLIHYTETTKERAKFLKNRNTIAHFNNLIDRLLAEQKK